MSSTVSPSPSFTANGTDVTHHTLQQTTRPVRGRGLHTGIPAEVVIRPRQLPGIVFNRVDLGVAIPVDLDCVRAAPRCTALVRAGVEIATVEHLLAALFGLGVRDAEVEVDQAELPILDGSALPWVDLLTPLLEPAAGGDARQLTLQRAVAREAGSSRCALAPAPALEIDCTIDFDHPLIGQQRRTWRAGDDFAATLAPARTFGLLAEREQLLARGLARGADLASVVVFDDQRVLADGGLRFADEPVRHKLLDALGDLALLGAPLRARVELHRCSHGLLIETLRAAVVEGALA